MRSNNKIQLLLVALVLALGIGYAYINSDLNINGTAQVRSANWDIHWANIAVTTGSVSASSPTISNQTTVNYSVILNTPGDYYEFTVDAVNGGSIDAMIDTISSKLNGTTITTLPAYLKYSVTYADGIELEPNHKLLHNTTEKYKVRIEYNTDIELNQIPASNQTLTLQFTVTYRQITGDAIDRPYDLYRSNYNSVNIGDNVSALGTTYSTYQELVTTIGSNYFLRHRISNNQVGQSDVGFIYNNNVYYLIGGGATYNSSTNKYNPDSVYYETNKATLLSAFGSSNCTESMSYSGYLEYRCSYSGSNFASTKTDGSTGIIGNGWGCSVEANGNSYCTGD